MKALCIYFCRPQRCLAMLRMLGKGLGGQVWLKYPNTRIYLRRHRHGPKAEYCCSFHGFQNFSSCTRIMFKALIVSVIFSFIFSTLLVQNNSPLKTRIVISSSFSSGANFCLNFGKIRSSLTHNSPKLQSHRQFQ